MKFKSKIYIEPFFTKRRPSLLASLLEVHTRYQTTTERLSKHLFFPSPPTESEMRTESEARPEDTESISSSAVSDTSSKNPRSDTFPSKAKSKAVKNPASLDQTRSV